MAQCGQQLGTNKWYKHFPIPTTPQHCCASATESTSRLTMRRKSNLGGKKRWGNARQWLTSRRDAVQKVVKSGEKTKPIVERGVISKMAKRMWTSSHEKEKKFNQKKEFSKRVLVCTLAFFPCVTINIIINKSGLLINIIN